MLSDSGILWDGKRLINVASILKANGTDGGLLLSAPDVDLQFTTGPVFVEFDGLPVPYYITDCTPRGAVRFVAHLSDVRTLEDALELVGRKLLMREEDIDDLLPEDESDEIRTMEDVAAMLVGWNLYDADASLVGEIEDFEPIPANTCLYVRKSSGEQIMLPLHEDFIISIDAETRSVTLRLPEGL